ncbi:MAG: hypothetical protein QG658_107 [Patescibacteria group bacterium]|jgi:protein-S-isoprenylcysteine O-methyltransferase Ste14|nr:hypothetical protein [Patescibacteria group bacterium]
MKKGGFFVFAQFTLLAILVLSAAKPPGVVSFLLAAAAILLGVSAMLAMTKRTLTVMPEVARGAELSTAGPYKYIRHPMYSAVMLLALAMLVQDFTILRLGVYVALVIVLIFKSKYEEKLLASHYRAYAAYQEKTQRFIPKIY